MRIIAGEARGRKLQVPSGNDVRPTADRVKEALFSSIGPDVLDTVILDAFAGSGALGLEALSRGARSAVFIELDRRHLDVLMANIQDTGFYSRATVISGSAIAQLRRLQEEALRFDIIFLDPPYDAPLLEESLHIIGEGGLLTDGGRIIAEHRISRIPTIPATLRFTRTRNYGSTAISTIEPIDNAVAGS